MGRRSRALTEALMALVSLALFAVVAFYVARYGRVLHETGSLSETLRILPGWRQPGRERFFFLYHGYQAGPEFT